MVIVLSIFGELLFISVMILLLYRLKPRLGLVPLYAFIGAIQYFQTILFISFKVDIFGGISIHAASSILFAASLFAILLIYIKEGARIAQRFIVAIILTNLAITALNFFAYHQQLANDGTVNKLIAVNYRVFLTGTFALILDAFILVILYEFFFTKIRSLKLYGRLVLSLLIILNFDAIIFMLGVQWGNPLIGTRILGQMIGKSGAALFYGSVLFIYLRYFDTIKPYRFEKRGKEDIFSIITYQGRFEKLKSEKAISDEQLNKIIKEKTKELEQSIKRFTVLASIRELRMDKFTSREQANEFLLKVKEAFETDASTIHLIKGKELLLLSSIGLNDEEKENTLDSAIPFFDEIITKKKCLSIEDTELDPAIIQDRENGRVKFYYKSCLGAPLISGNKVTGVLKLYYRQERRVFTTLETEHLQLVASQLANLIENSRLYEQNEKHKEVLVKQIIARKKAEEGILKSKEQFQNLVENISGVYWVNNLDTYQTLYISPSYEAIWGRTCEDLYNNPADFINSVHPDDKKILIEAHENIANTLQTNITYRIIRPDDEIRWIIAKTNVVIDSDGKKLEYGYAEDITDHKKAEQAIQESEEKYRTLVENATEALVVFDLESKKFVSVSKSAVSLFKMSVEELLKKGPVELSPEYQPDGRLSSEAATQNIKNTIAGERQSFEWTHLDSEGNHIPCEIWLVPLPSENRQLIRGSIINITERKKAEKQIENYNKELRDLTGHLQTIREEERSRIGQEIHDQLGQHLTVLKMDVSRLKKNIPLGKNKEQDLAEILSELDNCLQMVRKISADLRPSIIDDLGIIAALEWQAEDFERRTEISTRFYSNVSELTMPQTHSIGLFRIFQESLTNVARHADAKKVVTSLNKENGFLVMTISDNGKGFEANSIGGKRSLGLLGMRERTLLMNGNYEISSVPGKGTEVKVIIPI